MPSIIAEDEMGKSVALDLVRMPPSSGKSGTSVLPTRHAQLTDLCKSCSIPSRLG